MGIHPYSNEAIGGEQIVRDILALIIVDQKLDR